MSLSVFMIIYLRYIKLTARSIHKIKKLILFISKDPNKLAKANILFIYENAQMRFKCGGYYLSLVTNCNVSSLSRS